MLCSFRTEIYKNGIVIMPIGCDIMQESMVFEKEHITEALQKIYDICADNWEVDRGKIAIIKPDQEIKENKDKYTPYIMPAQKQRELYSGTRPPDISYKEDSSADAKIEG